MPKKGKRTRKAKRRAKSKDFYLKIEGDPTPIIDRMLATPPRKRKPRAR